MAQQKAAEPAEEVDDLIDELQPGAKLLKGQYTITRYINSGGFGITYLAKDSLDRDVVIKECFPSSVCRRSKVMVAARSRAHTAELRSVIQLFVREARNLAKIVHPNIVAVHQVFEDNGTAYMAIDFIDGLDLQQVIDGEGEMLAPDHIVQVTDKLLAAVGFIHDHDMLHRDISPDNVLINKAGEPILIDFGAAREHASKTTRAMSALRVVKDGYSPQEFYIAGSEQGPWSDLYALAATLYHLISGEAPVNGQARLAALAEDKPDPYVPLTGRYEGYPPGYLEAIDRAMNTMPKARLQTAAEWLEMYHRPAGASVDAAVHQLVSEFQRETVAEPPSPATPAPLAKAASRQAEPVAPAARGRSPVQMLAGVAVAMIVVAGGYLMLGKPETPVAEAAATEPVAASSALALEATAVEAAKAETAEVAAAPAAEPTATVDASVAAAETDTGAEPDAAATAGASEVEGTADAAAATETPQPTETTPAAVEVASVETEAPASVTDPVEADPVVTAETATTTDTSPEETASTTEAAPVVAPAPEAPAVAAEAAVDAAKPAASQIALAVWDVELPFTAADRIIGGEPLTIVQGLSPGLDRASAGSWLQQGLLIYGVNGMPTPNANALTTAILNAMRVDPDGKARIVVEYAGSDLKRQVDLLTVDAVRLVNLTNGVSVRAFVDNGVWTSVVTGVIDQRATTLKPGDVLFRDKSTTTPLDSATALETIIAALIEKGLTETEFSIIRDNRVAAATMRLVEEAQP